jgi:hypothetical protein
MPEPPPCRQTNECESGFNCFSGRCEAAPLNCNALKTDHPAASDGIYWIQPGPVPMRVYCDMRERLELCSEREEEHKGFARDASHLHFVMHSVLDLNAGVCKLWALRSVTGNWPLEAFNRALPANQRDTCVLLGFKGTSSLGRCPFGDAAPNTNCGFASANYLRWGTTCSGCQQNDGEHDRFTLQGPIHTGHILSNTVGTIATRCRVR